MRATATSAQTARSDLPLQQLRTRGFTGEIGDDLATRLVGATDNSIYRLVPSAILFPRSQQDLAIVTKWAREHKVGLTPRGGGTGTNGQSLTGAVVVDVSRHLNRIIAFDEETETVRVEPGVVLDQLNAFLDPLGYMFPPTVSTASRATIGGMFGTDASGKGSRIYGRTSDYVKAVKCLLEDGSSHWLGEGHQPTARMASIMAALAREFGAHEADIRAIFPIMNRGLTGYNLLDALPGDDGLPNLIKLLAGSEGTLALTTELHLRVVRKPSHRALTVIAYADCEAALAHVPALVTANPAAIEFLDDKIVALAAQSPFWSEVSAILGPLEAGRGFLFVEYVGHAAEDVVRGQSALAAVLSAEDGGNLGQIATDNVTQIAALWDMRKRAVGLLGAAKGRRVGIPFVEDAAVPPEKLAAFVQAFRSVLDEAGLEYGMFGHADVGCVHVRPMLDMRSEADRRQIRIISDKVCTLAKRYGGLIWGEHGKGVRGEYLPAYVGPDLYALMRRIKTVFDPDDRLNTGKLVRPAEQKGQVMRLDTVPFRGARDAAIDVRAFQAFEKAVACNGNAACYNWSPQDPMCPSYKATRDRVQGPKGRATLFREWAHARSTNRTADDIATIEQALHESLTSCLSCHSCSNACPVRVDIPDMKAHFLNDYFTRHPRPLRDHVIRYMERFGMVGRRMPALSWLMTTNLSRHLLEKLVGLVDAPPFARDQVENILKRHQVPYLGDLAATVEKTGEAKMVCLVPDSFIGTYESQILEAAILALRALGFRVCATPVLRNGKALHVRGFLKSFARERDRAIKQLNTYAETRIPLVGFEPAVLALYRREYQESPISIQYKVQSLDQFLAERRDHLGLCRPAAQGTYDLFLHCTEKTADPTAAARWRLIFAALGQDLRPVATGCCGMAGLFGHEREHQALSRHIFDLSWRNPMQAALQAREVTPLATGFSCRSQTKRLLGTRPQHPVEALLDVVRQAGPVHSCIPPKS